jgi:hypothetical protein
MCDPRDGSHGHAQRAANAPPTGLGFRPGRYGRMVPEVGTPLAPPAAAIEALGLAMRDGPQGRPSSDNPNIPAGYTYLGQFIDHDITLDTTSLTEVAEDPTAIRNFRTPRLDLDSLYGFGPAAQPSLYQRNSPGRSKLLLGGCVPGLAPVRAVGGHDLPRNSEGLALIGDERNDGNLLVAQTHLAFLRFHNAMVDRLRGSVHDRDLFATTRRAVTHLYQAMVLRDFLGRLCNPNDLEAAIAGRRFFRFEAFGAFSQPYLPVEFSAAAYRLGHTMMRESYNHNRFFRPGNPPFPPGSFNLLFEFTARSGQIGRDGPRASNRASLPADWIIDWRRYLDFGTAGQGAGHADGFALNLTRRIDPYLAEDLHHLGAVPGVKRPEPPEPHRSLAVLNLRRGVKMRLPAAQDLADFMGVPKLSPDAIAAAGPDGEVAARHGLHARTPLWYYILKEAELAQQGMRLGPLGSRIVAETFVGLLQGDSASILSAHPEWRFGQPMRGLELPGAEEAFTFADLVAFAAGGRGAAQLSPVDDPGNVMRLPTPPLPVS